MTTTTTKSLSQLDQEWNKTLNEYEKAKHEKAMGLDRDNLIEVLKVALDRIDTELEAAMNKHDEEFPFHPKGIDE
jgi:hypothetical protein